jgi:UDP-N-acetyl-D-mannosaminuronate dehydrogenase
MEDGRRISYNLRSSPHSAAGDTTGVGEVSQMPLQQKVLGLGCVGLPLALRAAEVGFSAVGYHVSPERVARLNAGSSYVEDISDDELAEALGSGRFSATVALGDCIGFNVAVIAVPAPLRESLPDLTYVTAAARPSARSCDLAVASYSSGRPTRVRRRS